MMSCHKVFFLFCNCHRHFLNSKRQNDEPVPGIQQLLQAEKRAKDKLEEAKKRKGKRLKQAKEEAIAEIDHYRLQREKDFRWKHSKIMGSHDDLSTKIDEETAAKIQSLTNNYHKNRENVLDNLLGKVYDLNPDIHPNYTYTI